MVKTGMKSDAIERLIISRPLALCGICYCVGASFGALSEVPALVWGAALTVFAAAFLVRKRAIYVFLALVFVGAWSNAALLQRSDISVSDLSSIKGTICEVNEISDHRIVATLDNVSIDGKYANTKVRLYIYDNYTSLSPQDFVTLEAKTWKAGRRTSPGGFDFYEYLARNGVWLCATAKSDVMVKPGKQTSQALANSVRDSLSDLAESLLGDNSTLAKAILLADKTSMPDELRQDFSDAGIAHLLAVSGLHISCLALFMGWLLRTMGLGRFLAFFITAPIIAAYVIVIGAPASAVRALVMYCMVESARVFGRRYDSLTAISLSFLILIAPNPLMITDAGMILSFSAILGINIFYPILRDLVGAANMSGFKRKIVSGLCVSLAAQIGTLPAASTMFGALNTYSLLTNILAIPLCTLSLPIIAVSLLLASAMPWASAVLAILPNALLYLMELLARGVSSLPGANIYVPAWPYWAVAVFAVLCWMMSPYSAFSKHVKRILLLSPIVLMLACVIAVRASLPGGLAITFSDAGDADSAIIRAEGKTYFMDLGEEGCPSVDYLCYTGQSVDAVFLTHPHSDHCSGLKTLMQSRYIPIIYLPVGFESHGTVEEISECESRGTVIKHLSSGDEVQLSENVMLRVLNPDADESYKDANDISLVTQISYGEGSALMTGDVSANFEPDTIMPCQLVKAAHHGSNDGTSEFLLRAASPSVVVITSSGTRDDESKKVLERIRGVGAAIYHTGENGMITAVFDTDGTLHMERYI